MWKEIIENRSDGTYDSAPSFSLVIGCENFSAAVRLSVRPSVRPAAVALSLDIKRALEGQGVLHPGKFLRSQPCACALLLLCFAMLGCFCLVIMVRPGWLAHIISHWVEMRNKVQFSKKGRADQFKASMVKIIERFRGRKKFFEWSEVLPQDLVLDVECRMKHY